MEFIQALNVQGRVISALTLRETRARYGDSKLGFFWALFEPFAHIIVFIGIFSAMGRAIPLGDSMGIFILTGIIPWLLYSNIVGNVMIALNANKAINFHLIKIYLGHLIVLYILFLAYFLPLISLRLRFLN